MPGCSGPLSNSITAASMTGSTELGPIQPQQDSVPLLDDRLFVDFNRPPSKPLRLSHRFPPSTPMTQRRGSVSHSGVQLTPLWEYVVRTKKFPKDTNVEAVFDEILERLRDPEWEVRQHALRVLVDLLPTFRAENIDWAASLVLSDLVENLGHPAPAVRKGSLDALRIYLLHSSRRDEMTRKILRDSINPTNVLDDYQTNVTTGVILATPLLLFPSRSRAPSASLVVREATQALAMRLVQVVHQEAALKSLAKIRDTVGGEEFGKYLTEVDESMKRNFELLCEIYGIEGSSSAKRNRRKSKAASGVKSLQRKDSFEDSIKEVVPVDKSWDSEDSDTSGIAEEDEDNVRASSSASVSSSARVVLETEIKFDEETAITMTILEEQAKKPDIQEIDFNMGKDIAEGKPTVELETAEEDVSPEERRKTPKRVHFGGEIVKLRTPDSEDAESVMSIEVNRQQVPSPLSHQQLLPVAPPRTRIPLPVSPATRMPSRPRSSSQPNVTPPSRQLQRLRMQKRSASSSPRREPHTHRSDLSPKKSILTQNTEIHSPGKRGFDIPLAIYRPHISRRDSMTSPRIVIEEMNDTLPEEPSFRVCEESSVGSSPRLEIDSSSEVRSKSPSPSLLGDICSAEEDKTIDSVFGDRSDASFQDKMKKDHENMMRVVYRTRSAPEQFDWDDKEDANYQGKDRRRSQSARTPGFEVFPRQERNYILMELASPLKDRSRRTSLEDNTISLEQQGSDHVITAKNNDLNKFDDCEVEKSDIFGNGANEGGNDKISEELEVDSNKLVESEKVVESENLTLLLADTDREGSQQGVIAEDVEKSALDAKERSSDSSSDSEWKHKEQSWEELDFVDDEMLKDFHNKEDWRAQVRGLERIASALRTPSALTTLEPRLGSLLLAVLGCERCCRVAAAGLAVARVVLAGVSEEALKNRLPLISWGLARHGGPNAAQLARLTMLRVGAGLFLEKLLQPQCIGARNSKTRENTLQLLIFSLVTFPSTEFKVKSAIDKVVTMVGDRRKRVRHSALDTLAILSQIYDSEDILEASKRYTKGKPDGPMIHAAIKTRLSRKLLPNVSSDGLVVYGLQISSNSQYTGADVEWIVAGSGSVSPGTGRTRGQLIMMSKRENDESELTDYEKKPKARPSSERSLSSGLEKDERTSSWKLLPQTDENDKPRRKVDRASKSADVSKAHTPAFELHSNQVLEEEEEEEDRTREPYSTPKRRLEGPSPNGEPVKPASTDESSTQGRVSSSAPPPRHESRIPVYMGTKAASPESSNKDSCWSEDALRPNANSSYPRMLQKRSWDAGKSAAPRTSYTISYAYPGRYVHPRYKDSCEEARNDPVLQKCREKPKGGFRENQRVFSYEKLNRGVDDGARHPRGFDESSAYRYTSRTCTETYETIYQRQRRLKESRGSAPVVPLYGHVYEGYNVADVKFPVERVKGTSRTQAESSPQKRNAFATPFDQSTMAIGKENIQRREANGNKPRVLNGGSKSATTISASDRAPSPRQGGGEARSSSGSSLSSNRSVSSRTRSRPALPAHTESDESNTTEDKSFNVISAEKRHSLHDAPDVPQPLRPSSDSEDELRPPGHSSSANSSSGRLSDQPSTNFGRSRSALSIDKVPPIERQPAAKHSLESLLREANGTAKPREDVHLPPLQCNGHGDQSSSVKSSPASRSSISERAFSARRSSKSITELNNHPAKESSESPADESVAFETLDFRNGVSATRRSTSATLADSPPGPRPLHANSNVSLYSSDSTMMSPSSPKRFVSQSMPVIARATDSDDPSPVPIGFDDGRLDESYSEDGSDGSHDELAGNKLQVSRLPTPVDLPKKLCKLSPCRLRPQRNCQRALPSVTSRHHDKHPEKTSKAVQQCLAQLDSSAWEMTLKGLRTLAQLAKEEPEQLDACVPGLLPRVLGKHVKNLRSQVARVACSTTSDVFRAHVRGIDQDLDEVAGVLLHRTADTNRFLREDCNAALDSMIEHFPPHRTIMTIVNRGAKHQNTVVHATTARLLYSIVSEIGPDCAMALPREVRDKLFSTTAKLLTDGNLQARKHAKETFRLLVPCEGFRKALTDSVPESTLRLIEKTLRSL